VAKLAHAPGASNTLRPIQPLYDGLALGPGALALEDGTTRRTFAELVADVEALAAALQSLDAAPGSRVGICAHNTREHLTALLATWAAGKVWVPLNPRNGRAELDAMIALTRPGIVVADESCLGRFTRPGAPVVVGRPGAGAPGDASVDVLIERHRGRQPVPVERAADDEAIIKFSGGTTGTPKGVVQPVRCLRAQVRGIGATFGFGPDDRNLIAAPLTHGTSCFVLPVLRAGGALVMLEQAAPAAILDAFEHRAITTVYLAPTMIYAMLATPGVAARRFPALRHVIYSAQAMPPERIREARAVFGPVIETAYGQVEAPQIIAAMRAAEFDDPRNLESVGRPSSVVDVRVVGPGGAPLAAGETGEVVVRGDLVMSRYLGNDALTGTTIVDGWLHTGDLGALDDRGYLYLKGRLREVIITGGFNVFPADVEAVLARHPAVQECCVFGVPDAKWGEAVHAAVHLRRGAATTGAELIAFVKAQLDSVKAPKVVHVVDALPRNAVGKVVRRAVRAIVAGEEEAVDVAG
jgi:acyl-CoA synthetase (AMP-forming)/AMP-acid ligase II